VQPFWGLLIDIEDFESKLCIYLEDRSATTKHPANGSKGVSSAWLGMLFAVLAVATNYTELSYHKRVATSQAFGILVNVLKKPLLTNHSSNLFSLSSTIKFFDPPVTRVTPGPSDPRICASK
jgi:hypothetical protein